jgi:hypothetical protein
MGVMTFLVGSAKSSGFGSFFQGIVSDASFILQAIKILNQILY